MIRRVFDVALLIILLVVACVSAGRADSIQGTVPTGPAQIAVVVSRKNPITSLPTRAELRRIFLRQKMKWPNGWTITVYERYTDNPIRQQFSQFVLGREPSDFREYWLTLKLTRGIRPPRACRSALLLKRYLQRVKGGIGYMYQYEVDDTVKVLQILEVKRR